MSQKIAPFKAFAAFMVDKDLWSRWEIQMPFQSNVDDSNDETYFIEAWAAARGDPDRWPPSFDFERTSVTLNSKEGNVNWAMDGEHISRFFERFMKGERL